MLHIFHFRLPLHRSTAVYIILLLFVVCGTTANTASAQFLSSQATGALELDPQYPRPGERITLRYSDYNQTQPDNIVWKVNGAEVESLSGLSTVNLTAPRLGELLTVVARPATQTLVPQSASITLVGNDVDIIIESNTRTPYFYEGRRVPSTGSWAHVVAIPHIYTTAGKPVADSELLYTWSMDNKVAKRTKGDSTFSFTIPSIGVSLISLTIETSDGSTRLERSFSLPATEPTLLFYRVSPTGLSRTSIADNYLLSEQEVTVRAEPYFVSRDIYSSAQHGWTLNGAEVNNNSSDPQMITLQRNNAASISDVGFSLRNLSALTQYVSGLFRLEFP